MSGPIDRPADFMGQLTHCRKPEVEAFLDGCKRILWGMFLKMLEYKLMFLGKQFLKIDKWFPSSKTCSKCGNVKEELKLSERSYKCECCGIKIDRDYNAALNIRGVGK